MATSQKLGDAELLFRSAIQRGLQPSWVTPNGLIAVATASGERYLSIARSSLNSHVSASLAKNKYYTRLILERHKVPNIPFARPQTHEQAEAFLHTHSKIIVKPVRGWGSRDIHIVTGMDQLQGLNIQRYIFEKYIAGKEMRYLVLSGGVIAVHESRYGASVEETRVLERISYRQVDWDPILVALSVRITQVLGLTFAAVDYLVDAEGKHHLLEVNTTPGLKWFHAPTTGPSIDVAGLFLEAMLEDIQKQA